MFNVEFFLLACLPLNIFKQAQADDILLFRISCKMMVMSGSTENIPLLPFVTTFLK